MSSPTPGHPRKKVRNVYGLRNQANPAPRKSSADSVDSDSSRDVDHKKKHLSRGLDIELTVAFDSARLDWCKEDAAGSDSEIEEMSEWEELDDEAFGKALADMALKNDAKDCDWIPPRFRRQKKGNEHSTFNGFVA